MEVVEELVIFVLGALPKNSHEHQRLHQLIQCEIVLVKPLLINFGPGSLISADRSTKIKSTRIC